MELLEIVGDMKGYHHLKEYSLSLECLLDIEDILGHIKEPLYSVEEVIIDTLHEAIIYKGNREKEK